MVAASLKPATPPTTSRPGTLASQTSRTSSYADSLHSLRDSLRSASPASIQASLNSSEEDHTQRQASSVPTHGDDHITTSRTTSPTSALSLSFTPTANMESLFLHLLSPTHLTHILTSPRHFPRFASFLARYRPSLALTLKKYLAAAKALAATRYANSLASSLWPGLEACAPDAQFAAKLDAAFGELLETALPGYVTHRLTVLVTEMLGKEIRGEGVPPALGGLVNGLAEVYCLTDPRMPDNPIIYASQAFYSTSGFSPAEVIGRNCRFLQGKQTSRAAVARLVEAIGDGMEICEVVLNYTKEGSPFVNLLLIAPLFDTNGEVRYFLGAQVDVNGLVEAGRGLESFEEVLKMSEREESKKQGSANANANGSARKDEVTPLGVVRELGKYMSVEERRIIQQTGGVAAASPTTGKASARRRQVFGMDDENDEDLWPAPSLGPNGRLPGVFQNYILVRPYPSLEIIYTAPGMRASNLISTPFLSWVRGPSHVRTSIKSALSYGQSFTAKISWLITPSSSSSSSSASAHAARTNGKTNGEARGHDHGHENNYTDLRNEEDALPAQASYSSRREREVQSRPLWIHCTPLLGEESRVGLWMVVMVKQERAQVVGLADGVEELGLGFRGK